MNEDSVTDDPSADRYYVDFSVQEPDAIINAVVCGVAEILERDPVTLPPLENVIDTDSLDTIFRSNGDSESDTSVSFEYGNCLVTVHGHGRVSFEEYD